MLRRQGPRSDPHRDARSPRVLAVVAIGVAVVVMAGRAWVKHQRRAAEESVRNVELVSGRTAPAMLLVGADQTRRRLEESGKPVLLHVWASWCPPCRRELPSLLALGQRLAGDIELVALTVDDDWAPVRDFFGGEVPSSVVMDANDRASAAWQLELLPETFLIGPDGSVRLRFVGPRNWSDASAVEVLHAALAEDARGVSRMPAPSD